MKRKPPEFPAIQPQEEARPYNWDPLTDGQKEAAAQAIGLLRGMLEAEYTGFTETAQLEGLVPMREDHHCNVIFIDGQRGSGKTSLMATLLQKLQNELMEGPNLDFPALPWGDVVIPVAFLDLHPLPELTHLMLHLVGKLEQQVEFLEGPASSWKNEDAPPWKTAGNSELPSRQRWRELFEAVVTWESNLERRAAHLDFDFYAWELKRQESRRREVGPLFRGFMDALCSDTAASPRYRHWMKKQPNKEGQPFFVIAIDDADLVPHRSVEVLDLLRKLWHPRFAFLVAGDIELFRTLLRNYLHGVFRKPLAHIDLPKGQEEGLGDDERLAIRLADNVLEKIFPPFHRCKLPNLSREAKLKEMKAPLEKLEIDPDVVASAGQPRNLRDYFEQETFATEALPGDLRSFMAEKKRLEGLVDRSDLSAERYRNIARFIRNLWQRLLQVEPLLREEKEVLDTVVTLDEGGMLVVQGSPLVCRYGARHTRELALDEFGRADWSLALGRDHRLLVSRLRSRSSSFPDSIKGALKLATNLAADVKDYYFLQVSPTPSGFNIDPVVVRWEDLEEYRYFRGFSWPLPDWHDFLSFTLFRKSWNKIDIDALLPVNADISDLEKLALTFLEIVLTIAESRQLRSQPPASETKRRLSTPPASETKKTLSRRVVELATNRGSSKRREVNSHWAYGRAGLLAAPESGLPAKVANEWLRLLSEAFGPSSNAWQRARRQLYNERRQQVLDRWEGAAPSNELVARILKSIDAESSDFDWLREIEPSRQKGKRGP